MLLLKKKKKKKGKKKRKANFRFSNNTLDFHFLIVYMAFVLEAGKKERGKEGKRKIPITCSLNNLPISSFLSN